MSLSPSGDRTSISLGAAHWWPSPVPPPYPMLQVNCPLSLCTAYHVLFFSFYLLGFLFKPLLQMKMNLSWLNWSFSPKEQILSIYFWEEGRQQKSGLGQQT